MPAPNRDPRLQLPSPGPGRPEHPCFHEPQRGMSLLEFLIAVAAVAVLFGVLSLAEAVV